MTLEQQLLTYAMLLNTQREHLCRNCVLERKFLRHFPILYERVNSEGQRLLLDAAAQILEFYYKADCYEHKGKNKKR